jgi:hypothetical protein
VITCRAKQQHQTSQHQIQQLNAADQHCRQTGLITVKESRYNDLASISLIVTRRVFCSQADFGLFPALTGFVSL